MCGRYTLSTPTDLLGEIFEFETTISLEPRFNIAPSQAAPVVRYEAAAGVRTLDLLQWGLVPFWAKDPAIGNRMINARSETVADKPAFRNSFRKRRCLVLADGFYEWKKQTGPKQPFFFHRGDGLPFAMAGLWDRWTKGGAGEGLETFTILTTSPNRDVAQVHQRMPVILDTQHLGTWLDPDCQDETLLAGLFTPLADGLLEGFPVSTYVNSPANDGPDCIEPLA